MKMPSAFAVALVCALQSVAAIADDAGMAKLYLGKVEKDVADAQAHPDAPQWWGQCEIDFKDLEEYVAKLPETDRAPYLAKLTAYRPQVEAGVRLYHGSILARHIRDSLASAHEEMATGPVSDRVLQQLEREFADPALKGIPEAQLKPLQSDYAEVKKHAAK